MTTAPQLYYFRDRRGNVGDDLNPWMWPQLLTQKLKFANQDQVSTDLPLLTAIGTLLNQRLPQCPSHWVFGSGVGYGEPPMITADWRIFFVRGPNSASKLGLAKSKAITDPAYLLLDCEFGCPSEPGDKVGFIPHVDSAHNGDWQRVCRLANIEYISPSQPVEAVLQQLQQCRLVLCEAMHGAIMADALRVPWQAVRCEPDFAVAKWQDWFASMDIEAGFADVPPVWNSEAGLGFSTQLKNRSKRRLMRMGFWSDSWTLPPAKPSHERDFENSAEALVQLAKVDGILSADLILERRLEQLREQVVLLDRALVGTEDGLPSSRL